MCDNYSTRLNTKLCYYDRKNDKQMGVIDNRESVYDTVTKEDLSTIDQLHIEGIDTSVRRFSKTVPEPKDNERFFAEKDDDSNPNKPSPDKLLHVYNVLGDNLPKLFIQPLDYTIYHPDIIFEDNIRNIRTVLVSEQKLIFIFRDLILHFKVFMTIGPKNLPNRIRVHKFTPGTRTGTPLPSDASLFSGQ
ncbi:unnamed protein product [Callosobruchus maculatus]|uniref:Uncharacterized protein n=1 Tax=Callosobruchus maculatus TaxID=64391 RepID=A0A653BD54_CALMS|nr:unnamed protein product [Callosobruchus maculatus]